jgi:Dual specificity phosphatase, catalytic domain
MKKRKNQKPWKPLTPEELRENWPWPDYGQVTPYLFTGGELLLKGEAEELAERGVTHIIDNRAEQNSIDLILHTDIEYLHNGVNDDGFPKPVSWFQRGVEFALAAINNGGKVYSHCAAGINRGPSMAYAILRAQGYSKREAIDAIQRVRPEARILYARDAERALAELGYTHYTPITPVGGAT